MSLESNTLAALIDLWPIAGVPRLLRENQNAVYAITLDGRPAILRISNSASRPLPMLEAEAEWMAFLSAHGVAVPAPIPSKRSRVVEPLLSENSLKHAMMFPLAPGRAIENAREVAGSLARRWGQLLGRINSLSVGFEPIRGSRRHWNEDGTWNLEVQLRLLDNPPQRLLEVAAWMRTLEHSPEVYGLIHGDLNSSNFHVCDETLVPFDFDDCCYHWRLMDLASPLYALYFDFSFDGEPLEEYRVLRQALVDGFLTEFPAQDESSENLDRFIEYRLGLLHCWLRNPNAGPRWLGRATDDWLLALRRWSDQQLSTGGGWRAKNPN